MQEQESTALPKSLDAHSDLPGQRTIYTELLLTRKDVQQLKSDIVEFVDSEPMYGRLFSNCGLYLVGSSLVKEDPKDIDVTLVGLDFRNIFTYGERFLNGPQEDDSTMMDYANDLGPTPVMLNLLEELSRKRQLPFRRGEDEWIPWITQVNPWYLNEEYEAVGLRIPLGNIDFFIHGENLLAKHWKQNQIKDLRPFEVLHEWKSVELDNVFERSTISTQKLPKFINPFGKNS